MALALAEGLALAEVLIDAPLLAEADREALGDKLLAKLALVEGLTLEYAKLPIMLPFAREAEGAPREDASIEVDPPATL